VLCHTLWYFYAFSRTNLLIRCHNASSLFSAIFVFQKSYTGNILRIERNKSRTSNFSRTRVRLQSRDGAGPGPGHTIGRRGPSPGRATRGWAPWSTSWRRPSAYIFPSTGKPKSPDQFSTKPTASRRHRRYEIGRVQKLFPAPCRRGEFLPEAFFITMVASGVMCE
jgi:hypothetical protein